MSAAESGDAAGPKAKTHTKRLSGAQVAVPNEYVELVEIGAKMAKTLDIGTCKQKLRTYKNAFTGKSAVEWLIKNEHAEDIPAALRVAQSLMKASFIRHVSSEEVTAFKNNDDLYTMDVSYHTDKVAKEVEEAAKGSTVTDRAALMALADTMLDAQNGIACRDMRIKMRRHRRCFTGKDAVAWMITNEVASTNAAAVKLGNALAHIGVFCHITRSHSFKNENIYYRFRYVKGDASGKAKVGGKKGNAPPGRGLQRTATLTDLDQKGGFDVEGALEQYADQAGKATFNPEHGSLKNRRKSQIDGDPSPQEKTESQLSSLSEIAEDGAEAKETKPAPAANGAPPLKRKLSSALDDDLDALLADDGVDMQSDVFGNFGKGVGKSDSFANPDDANETAFVGAKGGGTAAPTMTRQDTFNSARQPSLRRKRKGGRGRRSLLILLPKHRGVTTLESIRANPAILSLLGKDMKNGVAKDLPPIVQQTHKHAKKAYKHCWRGKDAVDWFMTYVKFKKIACLAATPVGQAGHDTNLNTPNSAAAKARKYRNVVRGDVVGLFQQLIEFRAIHLVAGGAAGAFEDSTKALFRFHTKHGQHKRRGRGHNRGDSWSDLFKSDWSMLKTGAGGRLDTDAVGSAIFKDEDIGGGNSRASTIVAGSDKTLSNKLSLNELLTIGEENEGLTDELRTPLTDAEKGKQEDMLLQKLRACCKSYAPRPRGSMVGDTLRGQRQSKTSLMRDIKAYILSFKQQIKLSDSALSNTLQMVCANIFRDLPSNSEHGPVFRDRFDLAQEIIHVKDPSRSWVHLDLAYGVLTAIIDGCGLENAGMEENDYDYAGFSKRVGNLFLTRVFLRKFIYLLRSHDRRERRVLRSSLIAFYVKFPNKRRLIISEMGNCIHRFVMMDDVDCNLSNAGTELRVMLSALYAVLLDSGWPDFPDYYANGDKDKLDPHDDVGAGRYAAGAYDAELVELGVPPLSNESKLARERSLYLKNVLMTLHYCPIDVVLRFRQELAVCVCWFVREDAHPVHLLLPPDMHHAYTVGTVPTTAHPMQEKFPYLHYHVALALDKKVAPAANGSKVKRTASGLPSVSETKADPGTASVDRSKWPTVTARYDVYAHPPALHVVFKYLLKLWPIRDSWKQVFFLEVLSSLLGPRSQASLLEQKRASESAVEAKSNARKGSDVSTATLPEDAAELGEECAYTLCQHSLDWRIAVDFASRLAWCMKLPHLEVSQTSIKALDRWLQRGGTSLLRRGHPLMRHRILPELYHTIKLVSIEHKFKPARVKLEGIAELLKTNLESLPPDQIRGLAPHAGVTRRARIAKGVTLESVLARYVRVDPKTGKAKKRTTPTVASKEESEVKQEVKKMESKADDPSALNDAAAAEHDVGGELASVWDRVVRAHEKLAAKLREERAEKRRLEKEAAAAAGEAIVTDSENEEVSSSSEESDDDEEDAVVGSGA